MFRFVIVLCVFTFYGILHAGGQNVYLTPETSNQDTAYVFDLLDRADDVGKTNPELALDLTEKALMISRNIHSTLGIARSLCDMGLCLTNASKFPQSRSIFYQAIPYCYLVRKEDQSLLPRVFNNLGNVFIEEGRLDSAIRYYYQALKELKVGNRRDSLLLIIIYGNIGGTFAGQRQDHQALYYLNKSISLAAQCNDSQTLAPNYANLGLVYENLKMGDSAIYFLRRSQQVNGLLRNKSILPSIYYRIGMTYGRQGNLQQAKAYFDSATFANPKAALKNGPLQTGYGNVYSTQGKYKLAIAYYQKAIDIAIEKGDILDNLTTYNNMAESYHNDGNNLMSYTYQKIYADLRDSQMNMQKIKAINQLEVQYRMAAQEKDLVAKQLFITLQQKRLLQKNFWLGCILVGALLLAVLSIMLYRNYNQKRKSQQADISNLKLQQQTNRMQALMQGEQNERIRIARELHDGIGSIMAAARMHLDIFKGDQPIPAYAATYQSGISLLDEAYRGLRYTAHNLLPPEQLLEEGLVAATALYCNKISKPGTFTVHFQHYGPHPTVAPEIAISFYRIIQELIHNAAKHAEATEVIVEIGVEATLLSITVEDNGKGWKTDNELEGGIGLRNLKDSITILAGSLEIDSRPDIGTTIYLTCPMDKNE
jgi:two-component system NarL family sensor kinase